MRITNGIGKLIGINLAKPRDGDGVGNEPLVTAERVGMKKTSRFSSSYSGGNWKRCASMPRRSFMWAISSIQ